MSLRLNYRTAEGETSLELGTEVLRIGRSVDNDLILSDPSVSRHHCEIQPSATGWVVHDLGSTNGVRLGGSAVHTAILGAGDRLTVGVFELWLEGLSPGVSAPAAKPSGAAASAAEMLADATLIKRLEEMTPTETGREPTGATLLLPASLLRSVREQAISSPATGGEATRGERPLSALLIFAGRLLATETDDEVLDGVLEAAFAALDVERGFVFLVGAEGRLECALARFGGRRQVRPEGPLPVSETLLSAVVDQRVALVTGDALRDTRLSGGESLRLHQIRSALCAPLWSGERVVGVVQVDTPFRADAFDERDLELVSALANYAAVAVERLRNARRVQREQRRRAGLERYHSPAVVEEILRRSDDGADGDAAERPLRAVEVSVLFADLVGFTGFAERSTPQEVAGLLSEFFDRAVGEIFARGGTLDKFIGDCVMAVFGAPVAQRDHAGLAVAAGLAIQERVAEWNAGLAARGRSPVAARVAINSGPVVAGEIGSERRVDYTVLGDTVNVAARLESAVAAPGEVVIGPRTRELLGELDVAGWRLEELGAQRLAGLSREIAAYRVRRGVVATPSPG